MDRQRAAALERFVMSRPVPGLAGGAFVQQSRMTPQSGDVRGAPGPFPDVQQHLKAMRRDADMIVGREFLLGTSG